MGHGVDLQGQDIAGAADADGVIKLLHLDTRTAELCGDGFQMLRGDVFDEDIASGGSGSHHIAARLDLIRDDAVGAAVHPLDAAHLDDIGARAAHIRAAHIQEVCQIDDMRLLGTVLKDGLTLRHDGGKHPVHGRADADLIEEDMSAGQALLGADRDHAVVHAVLRAEGAEGLEVLVDGAGAKVTAAGHGHLRLAKAGQQRAEEVVAGAHLAGQIVRHIGAGEVGGVVAGRMPTAAFFAPEMVTAPCRGLPPVITNFSNFMISLSWGCV